jgi:Lactate dehydrogenase and related dehydrogenases
MKISLLEPIGVDGKMLAELSKGIVDAGHEFVYYDTKTADPAELAERSKDSEIVIIANNPFPEQAVRAAQRLKMLDVAFTGIDHVAVGACKENGVMICNAANYSNQTVAELAIGLAIGLLRFIPQGGAAARNGKTGAELTGREIAGRTVGIIGTGRIGMMTARLFKSFGARILGYSRSESEEARALGVTYAPIDTLMRESDIISLHIPCNAATKGFISAEKIALMKKDAILINCARGPIVDNTALAEALNGGAIAGAGIDVFDMEPPLPADYALLHAKNTLLTPHIAFASEESMLRRAKTVFQNVYAFLNGSPENVCAL